MDVSVLISFKKTYEPIAWSAGYCPYCQQLEAVRIEQGYEIISIWFLPVVKQRAGTMRRCDFCERALEDAEVTQAIPLLEWSPASGVDALVRRLDLPGGGEPHENDSENRLRSLLAATQEASSINSVDITFGITTGALVGIAVCLPLGIYLFDSGVLRFQFDRLGFIFASILTGLGSGAVAGAVLHALLKRGKVAFSKLNATCGRYGVDTSKLEELSQEYGRIVQRAARAVREAGFANFGA